MLGELLAAVDEPELMRVAFHLLISVRKCHCYIHNSSRHAMTCLEYVEFSSDGRQCSCVSGSATEIALSSHCKVYILQCD